MCRLFPSAFALLLSSSVVFAPALAQTPPPPQTARQAVIEMFFGTASNHLEKHLPDATRQTLKKLGDANGRDALSEFSMLATQAKTSGAKIETFDTGPTLLSVEDSQNGKVEITVDRDDLMGDEDQIEVALHVSRGGKEETLPFIPRVTFSMKSEADVWRLNEISIAVRLPLADPDFLKSLEARQRSQNEQMTIWSVHSIVTAEKEYQAAHGNYACSLSALATAGKQGTDKSVYLWDKELASGKKNGYIFVISGCEASRYKIVAEPATADSSQRAFCSDEGGAVRASADGKATTCLSSGEPVDEKSSGEKATGIGVAVP